MEKKDSNKIKVISKKTSIHSSKNKTKSSLSAIKKRKKEFDWELEQYKINDLIQLYARSGEEYWYGDIWKKVNKCVLCDLRKRYVITEKDGMVLTVNIYPYIDGNLMIVPKRHLTHIKQLTDKEWNAIRKIQYVAQKMLKLIFGYSSVWLIYREGELGEKSQKTVEHMHIHLLPYKSGLVNWNFQKIKLPPFEVASIFRDNQDTMEKLFNRFDEKYDFKK